MKNFILYLSICSILHLSVSIVHAESKSPESIWQQVTTAWKAVDEVTKIIGFRSSANTEVGFQEALSALVDGSGVTIFSRKKPSEQFHISRKYAKTVNGRHNFGYQFEQFSEGVRKKIGILDLKWTEVIAGSNLPAVSDAQAQWLVPKENVERSRDCIVTSETLQFIGEDFFYAFTVQMGVAGMFAIPFSIIGLLMIGKSNHSAKYTMAYFTGGGLVVGFLISFMGRDSIANVKYCY